MANSARPQSYTFRDNKQQTARVNMFILNTGALTATQLQTNAGNILNDLQGLSNAVLESAKGPFTSVPVAVTAGAAATYETVEDKAQFVFTTATGILHRYDVPAPLAAIFLADGETVDFTNSLVKQFVADMINATFSGTAVSAGQTAGACSRNAEALSGAVGGIRIRKRLQRKFNIYTRAPSGGQGE